VAREHGDLKENSEYKMAKQDQQVLMAQKSQLERELGRARITDFSEATADQIGVGNIVDLSNPVDGSTSRYTVLGGWDSDPDRGIISYRTPLGRALLGRKKGDQVTVKTGGNEETYAITGIARYVESR